MTVHEATVIFLSVSWRPMQVARRTSVPTLAARRILVGGQGT